MGRGKRSEMKRRLEKLTDCPGVFRILLWDETLQKWTAPEKGMGFRVFIAVKDDFGNRRRISKYFATLAQAKVFWLKTQKDPKGFDEPTLEKSNPEAGILFGEVVKVWREVWLPNKNPSTQARYVSYLQHFRMFWNLPVEKISPSDIDRWIVEIKRPEYLAKGHTTRCDYKHEFSVLRGILNFYASRYNRNYRLPFLKDHKPMLKVREKMKISKDLTVEEFQLFMSSLKQVCIEFDCEVVYYLAFMQYATYCRVQEAAALHYEDFDFGRNKITINKKMQWSRSKGYETKLVDGSKANGGKELPMGDLAARVFREWTMKSGVRSGMLFTIDGEMLTYRQIEYRYTQALGRAGLPFRATHLLRHASLTEFYDHTKDLLLTAKMAGQRDLKSTTKYTKVRDERVVQGQKGMDKKLSNLVI
jgi:integrase